MKVIEVRLPWWCATIAGFIVIGIVALTGIAIAQSHTIDRLYTKVAVLENELAIAADQRDDLARVLDNTRGALVELQHWRVNITLASRMGWPRAVQYIRENPLPFPEEDPRGSR